MVNFPKLPTDKALARQVHLRKLPLVEVQWLDATSDERWQTHESTRKLELIKVCTVGWLTRRNKSSFQVTQSITSLGTMFHVLDIPRQSIQRIIILRNRKPQRRK